MITQIKSHGIVLREANFVYTIEERYARFYIIGNDGYDGFEGDGHTSLVAAIKHAEKLIKQAVKDSKK